MFSYRTDGGLKEESADPGSPGNIAVKQAILLLGDIAVLHKQMRPTVTDRVVWSVGHQFVGLTQL